MSLTPNDWLLHVGSWSLVLSARTSHRHMENAHTQAIHQASCFGQSGQSSRPALDKLEDAEDSFEDSLASCLAYGRS